MSLAMFKSVDNLVQDAQAKKNTTIKEIKLNMIKSFWTKVPNWKSVHLPNQMHHKSKPLEEVFQVQMQIVI